MSATSELLQPTRFDLTDLAGRLRAAAPYAKEGHTARTLLRERDSRVVLVAVRAGERIPAHVALETATVVALTGKVALHLEGAEPVELRPCELLAIPAGMRHDVEAREESAFLLVLGALRHGL